MHTRRRRLLFFCSALALNQRNGGFHDEHILNDYQHLFSFALCVGFQLSVCVCARRLSNWNMRAAARGAASSPLFFPFSDDGIPSSASASGENGSCIGRRLTQYPESSRTLAVARVLRARISPNQIFELHPFIFGMVS
jgi:hypothetical protein